MNTIKTRQVSPILKWVGGKRQLLNDIKELIPNDFSTYIEPFVGGGAVLFDLQPSRAIINDYNTELINVYEVVRNNVEELIDTLKEYEQQHCKEFYYKIRLLDRTDDYYLMNNISKASRTIYLNKTCFNGLYRVNKKGQFNSPFGQYKNPSIVNEENLRAASEYFNTNDITILNGDFTDTLQYAEGGAFVYFDPPYVPLSESSSFTSYTKLDFDLDDQVRLKNECDKLNSKNIKFLLSNSYCDFITDLYKDYNIKIVKAKRSINSKGNKRGEINEVLIYNYD